MNNDFCVFILTHGRPNRVYTYDTLKECGYSGDLFLIVDNEDETVEEYKKIYGDKVLIFDKQREFIRTDTPDLSTDKRCIIYARNICFDIAKEKGYRYFLELDDDYTSFCFRYPECGSLKSKRIKNINLIFQYFCEFLEESGALTVAFAQAGDFIGGLKATGGGAYSKKVLRKAMNSFFCSTERPFRFVGRINEDVNTYTSLSNKGNLFFTITDIALNQKQTQTNSGGMSEMYIDNGTYVKSFYTVIYSPQAVTVERMGGNTYHRIHHHIDWSKCAPMILSDKYKKRGD